MTDRPAQVGHEQHEQHAQGAVGSPASAASEGSDPTAEGVAAQRRSAYWRGQVLPRLRPMVKSLVFWIPVILGLVLPWAVEPFATIQVQIADVAGFGMNYAAIGFGACVTGAVLAIGLPGPDRIRGWATIETSPGFSGYSDLVFALTWAGMAQLSVLFVCMTSLVVGGDAQLLPGNPRETHTVLLGIALAVFFYGVTQLLILVQTVSQLGNLIDFQERLKSQAGE
jgi:hypothetical protein